MTIQDDVIELLKAETEVLYDHVETIEAAIRWCITNKAIVSFLDGVSITFNQRYWKGETFLDLIDDIKKELAEEGERPYADSP